MPHPEIDLDKFKISITCKPNTLHKSARWLKHEKEKTKVVEWPASFAHFTFGQLTEIIAAIRREPWKLEYMFPFNKCIYRVRIYHDEIVDPKPKEKQYKLVV